MTPVTNYLWDQKWDAVKRITQPLGDFVEYDYDAANGNRLFQQDGRGAVSQTAY